MQATMKLSAQATQKVKLSMARWGHHDFLQTLVGKEVVLIIDAGINPVFKRAKLLTYDNYTVGIAGDNGEIGAVIFKSKIVVVEPYDPAQHDRYFQQPAQATQGAAS